MKFSGPIYNMQVGPRYRQSMYGALGSYAARQAGKMLFQEAKRAYTAPSQSAPRRSSRENKGGGAPLRGVDPYRSQKRRHRKLKLKKCRNMKGMALKKEVCKLSNQIKELKHAESASLGKMTYRSIKAWNHLVGDNVQSDASYAINRPADYETVLANLKYYDPAVPGTLVTASAATGTYQKNFLVKNIFSKLSMRNNYQTDVEVIAYLCTPKSDSSISPASAWTDGITTDAGNITARTEYGCYPTDFDVFRDLWKAKRACSKILSPGQSTEVSHSVQNVEYDPALYDEHSASYQQRFKTFVWLVVLKGTVAHDTAVSAQQGTIAGGLDVIQSETWTIQYDAGVNLSYVVLDTTLDTPTNSFVQSHQPIADNIGYSVA